MEIKDVIIFGAGRMGEKFVYQHFDKVKIQCFWDNQKTGELLGYPIQKPEPMKGCLIIVAAGAYLEIRRQLIQMGYDEFIDFIPASIFQKKMAVVYGNCHMNAVKEYLESHKAFGLEYGFYPFPMIQNMKNQNLKYKNILCHCQLFLHQSIRKENVYGKEYASEQMISYVKETCQVISVPNLYGLPKYLFPQLDTHSKWQQGSFCPFFIDRNVAAWLESGKGKREIANYILNGGVYSKSQIISMWEEFKEKICRREQQWDIKISDYIFENYKRERIFCDINHITSRTARVIAIRILKYMGFQEIITLELPIMDDMESIIYRDVKEALGLEFQDTLLRKYSSRASSFNNYEMNMDEYIEQLCRFTQFCISGKAEERQLLQGNNDERKEQES